MKAKFESKKYKVFIINNEYVSKESADDLVALCQEAFPHADIILTPLDMNLTGANHGSKCIIVVPGGQAFYMGVAMNRRWKISDLVNIEGYGYFGVCAGAYLACEQSFVHINENPFKLAQYGASLNVVGSLEAYGPFVPSEEPGIVANFGGKKCNAHFVGTDHPVVSNQTYIMGCGFANIGMGYEVVSRYSGSSYYSFLGANFKFYSGELASCVRKENILLAGTHLEAVVPGSKITKKLTPTGDCHPNYLKSLGIFAKNREQALGETITLVHSTFRYSKS